MDLSGYGTKAPQQQETSAGSLLSFVSEGDPSFWAGSASLASCAISAINTNHNHLVQEPNADPESLHSRLLIACSKGNLSAVAQLLEAHSEEELDPAQPSLTGATPLAVACKGNYPAIVDLLLSKESVRRGINRGKLTPLIGACCGDHDDFVRKILAVEV